MHNKLSIKHLVRDLKFHLCNRTKIGTKMPMRKYVFAQITSFLPQQQFRRIVKRHPDKTQRWAFSYWNHLLVLMFGQLTGCDSLWEHTDIITAHAKRCYYLGFGKSPVSRSILSNANMLRDSLVFKEFLIINESWTQRKNLNRPITSCFLDDGLSTHPVVARD